MSYRYLRQWLPGPQQIAECGGPCEADGPQACDCQAFDELKGLAAWTDERFRALFDAIKRPIYAQAHPGAPSVIVGHEAVDPADFGRAVLAAFTEETNGPA